MRAHITAELLHSVARGEEPIEALVAVALGHLAHTCPRCRPALTGGEAGGSLDRWEPQRYDAAFARALEAAEALARRLPEERARAGREVAELLALPSAERRGRVARASSRFRSPVLAEHLIAAGRSRVEEAPEEAAELASLALRVIDRSEPGVYGASLLHELRTRARAHRADAYRAGGDLRSAERCLARLTEELSSEPLLDPHARGEVLGLLARLRRDQHQPPLAAELLRRATALTRRCGGAPTPEVRLPRLWPRAARSWC